MSVSISHIRSVLQESYPTQEAANLTRIVCCEMLGQNTVDYYLGKDIILSSNQVQELEGILGRLRNFEPIQYVQGVAHFLGLLFRVAPGVLIPRPETEELIERMLTEVPVNARILDIGTGSGCIAISLSKHLPAAQVTAWDVSKEALAIAELNNEKLQTSVRFMHRDVLIYQPAEKECYEVIVSNPPYITETEKQDMESNVLDWEPSLALFIPDDDPLRFYRRIAVLGQEMLVQGGKLYFEINRAFGGEVVAMLEALAYGKIILRQDISHNDRFVIAEKVS